MTPDEARRRAINAARKTPHPMVVKKTAMVALKVANGTHGRALAASRASQAAHAAAERARASAPHVSPQREAAHAAMTRAVNLARQTPTHTAPAAQRAAQAHAITAAITKKGAHPAQLINHPLIPAASNRVYAARAAAEQVAQHATEAAQAHTEAAQLAQEVAQAEPSTETSVLASRAKHAEDHAKNVARGARVAHTAARKHASHYPPTLRHRLAMWLRKVLKGKRK